MATTNIELTNLPMATLVEVLSCVLENQIGNWERIFNIIHTDPTWHSRKDLVLVCSEEDATFFY